MQDKTDVWQLQAALNAHKTQQLWRQQQAFSGSSRQHLRGVNGEYLNFSSNDYLGLASSVEMQAALAEGVRLAGTGSGASHLISGHHQFHHQLEAALAEWVEREAAIVFSTGYMANLAVVTTFLGKKDGVFADKWNHASLIDAVQLSKAQSFRYRHNDFRHLAQCLHRFHQMEPGGQNDQTLQVAKKSLLVTDAVFSMDGDIAPLHEMLTLAKDYPNLRFMVDDAHGIGVLGNLGRGSLHHLGLNRSAVIDLKAQDDPECLSDSEKPVERIPLLMGTLGKALGCFGAFVAGPSDWIETLRQFARPYIYTTALPPALCYATLTAIRLVKEGERRQALQANLNYFKVCAKTQGLPLMASDTPIQPLLLGDVTRTLAVSEALQRQGFWVSAIRPPTVPKDGARLRITLNAEHSCEQIDRLLEALHKSLELHV